MIRFAAAMSGLLLAGWAVSPGDAGRTETLYLAGGCYWGVEEVFEHVKGVKSVVAGFAYGAEDSVAGVLRRPNHGGLAEAVRIKYDPDRISYSQLLQIFFTVAHDPTQLDRQGPDVGPRYRSSLFVTDTSQLGIARAYLDSVRSAARPGRPVVTDLVLLDHFKAAGEDQQDFAAKNPTLPYIVINDKPKVEKLREKFPGVFEG
ncbi:MAG TPA: peptide-methionine (S)-S-oxide reductase MsrA [Gemmatimonadales bacterium]|jgi:peptide-methionine (S)-S-oxide reductase|nr:peptide-methionine (S)-S-oxide reductase MsrA [Gemmatimonadales bacterium]